MKVTKKTIIEPEEIVFAPISAETTAPYETSDVFNEDFEIAEPFAEELPDTFEPLPEDDVGGGTLVPGITGATSQTITYSDVFWDTNEPTTATNLEGVPVGSTFALGTSSIEVLKAILYPTFLRFDSFITGISVGPYYVGQTTTAGTYEASWEINDIESAKEDSIVITRGSTVLISDFPLAYVEGENTNNVDLTHPAYSLTAEGNLTFTISLTANDETTISKTQSLRWNYPLYAGKLANETLTSGNITSLTSYNLYTISQMKSGITRQYASTASPEYLYWCVPKAVSTSPISGYPQYDTITSFTDVTNPNTTQTVPMIKQSSSVTTTLYGLSIEFDVYRTSVPFAAIRSIKVAE